MGRDSLFRHRTRRHEIDEAEARLARHKRAVVSRSVRLGGTLYGKLTEPGAFIIAGSTGFLIGEFSRPHAGTERSPVSIRPPESTLDDATFWFKTAVALLNWARATLVAPGDPSRSGEHNEPHPAAGQPGAADQCRFAIQ